MKLIFNIHIYLSKHKYIKTHKVLDKTTNDKKCALKI